MHSFGTFVSCLHCVLSYLVIASKPRSQRPSICNSQTATLNRANVGNMLSVDKAYLWVVMTRYVSPLDTPQPRASGLKPELENCPVLNSLFGNLAHLEACVANNSGIRAGSGACASCSGTRIHHRPVGDRGRIQIGFVAMAGWNLELSSSVAQEGCVCGNDGLLETSLLPLTAPHSTPHC